VDKTVEVSFANLEEGTEQWFVCFIFFFKLKRYIFIFRPLHFVRITVGNQVRKYLILFIIHIFFSKDCNKFIKPQTTY